MRLNHHLWRLMVILCMLKVTEGKISQVSSEGEYGSYTNPNARAFDKCTAQELIKLSQCCNDVLTKLNTCKAEDLACECCALQSIDKECYSICPGNPSVNFLTVLINDCSSLQGVNACGLPFKKYDEPAPTDPLKENKLHSSKAKVSKMNSDSSPSSTSKTLMELTQTQETSTGIANGNTTSSLVLSLSLSLSLPLSSSLSSSMGEDNNTIVDDSGSYVLNYVDWKIMAVSGVLGMLMLWRI